MADPFALCADGTARDPEAFQAAIRGDAAKLAEVQRDPEVAAVLLGADTAAMQRLLKSAFEAELDKARNAGRRMAERTLDAQRASAPVPRDTAHLYAQLAASGLEYGPAFRLLRNVHVPEQTFSGITSLLQSGSGLHGQAPGMRRLKGLYMHGGVGCGKTMLMDLFVTSAPPEMQVRRTHYHDFMLEVHGHLAALTAEEDPLRHVADDIAARVKVLALDELFVTDVADAMILARLFGRLWDDGLVLVATSNRAPDALYEGGLQRSLFMPFIARLKGECVVHDMESGVDYRRLASHTRGLYFTSPDRGQALYEQWLELSEGEPLVEVSLPVAMGRSIEVEQAAGSTCLFDFDDLCGRPVAAADYIALCSAFDTVALAGVPVFGAANRAAAYRFVTLVDVMYEHRVRFLCAADAVPFELFTNILTQEEARRAEPTLMGRPEVVVDDNIGFAKDRTVSRLTEMQSTEYLIQHARAHRPQLLLALEEAQARRKQRRQEQQQRQQQLHMHGSAAAAGAA